MSTCDRARKQHRLLLVNKFGVHITEQFLENCDSKKRYPILLPASFHTSVDGKLFRDYRKFHGEAVSRQTAQGDHYFDKSDFLYSINELRQQMFVRRKIKTELEARGIWPMNDEIVVKWLQSKPESTDEPMDETVAGDEPNLPSTSSAKTTRAKYFLQKKKIYVSTAFGEYRLKKARKNLTWLELQLTHTECYNLIPE